ncbi:Zinc uptake regulation protein ZUR [Marinobacterium lacunae]|uniref:Zinc uptake regulation protein ZUR n=1 Tax=Marinobacterium lacunae TaxID=1232683 RepID=A0A081FVA4_9GAMM|nr:Fur family transcriptional regulator [Marinobacterium lacunae]KEA62459.1 Zinc uptake regulation protein ZUR [Marinobacterium lacunae]
MNQEDPGFESDHNHQHCIAQALETAHTLCRTRHQRLTPVRELVLKLVWQNHQPLGAYELLPALADAGFNSAPPTVYRALEFLQEQGFVHRIASLNAYVGCPHPERPHRSGFLICRNCKRAVELNTHDVHSALKDSAATLGFEIEQEMVEVVGLCPDCRTSGADHAQ